MERIEIKNQAESEEDKKEIWRTDIWRYEFSFRQIGKNEVPLVVLIFVSDAHIEKQAGSIVLYEDRLALVKIVDLETSKLEQIAIVDGLLLAVEEFLVYGKQMENCVITGNTQRERMKNFAVQNWGYIVEKTEDVLFGGKVIDKKYFLSKELSPLALPLEREGVLKRMERIDKLQT